MTTLSNEDVKKLKRVIDEGVKIQQEVADLKLGLKDTVKAVADEIGVKPKLINKAIRTAFKESLDDEKEEVSELEELLASIGRA